MQSAHLLLSPSKIGTAGAAPAGGVAAAAASPSSSRFTQSPVGLVEIAPIRGWKRKRRSGGGGESLSLCVIRNADQQKQQRQTKNTGYEFKISDRIIATSTSKSGPLPLSGFAKSSSRPRLDKRAASRMMALTVKQEEEAAVGAPSWESLEETLGLSSGSGAGKTFEAPERLADARERVFSPGEDPKLVFYRDSWSWCPYCEQVWLQLEEKKIPYRVEKIDMSCYGEKPQWFKDMVPSGTLPAVKLLPQEQKQGQGKEGDGEEVLLFESEEIMFRLEEQFPDKNPLLPARRGSPEFSKVEWLLKLEKELVAAWVSRLLQSDTSDYTSDSSSSGAAFESAMDRVNSALQQSGGPYFLGTQFSLVDVIYAPFLERIAASMPYWLGVQVRGTERWPALNAWFDATDSRPSYQAMKADDFSIVHNLESQLGPCNSSDAGLFQRALVDGTHGSWDLPLKPEATAWGADDGAGRGGAREEAANYLIANHEKLVESVLRERAGAGGVMTNGESHRGAIDEGFRYVAEALLVGVQNVDLPEILPEEVGIAATLVKNQVAVPRDLTYPAARQLRAHLLWLTNRAGLGLRVAQAPESSVNQESGWNSWLYPGKEELPDDKEMTIFDHLEELRQRLAVSAGAVGVAILGCFVYSKELIRILEAPVYSQGVRFLQLSPGEFFFTTLKVSGYCGLLLGSPVILYEIIAFVLPGLTRSERRFLGPIVLGSSVLFYLGVVFSYIVLTPAALNFFVNYAEGAVESLWSIDQYFEFVLVLLFSTGLSFQVPVIQLLLGQTRLVSGDQMLSLWRYVVVGSVVVAAILTPSTDPLTQILLAGPLMGLYFGGAFLVKYLVPPAESTS